MHDAYKDSIGSLLIKRYDQGQISSLTDSLGKESSIMVELSEGRQITVACTPIHLEELKAGILYSQSPPLPRQPAEFPDEAPDYARILEEQKKFSSRSDLFIKTGSVHSGQLMDLDYTPIFFTEDMGRHNVLDKLIGYGLLHHVDLTRSWLMISSRMPMELVAKAHMAGIRRICCISAPTREAVEFARERKIILLGMFRGTRFNIYSSSDME